MREISTEDFLTLKTHVSLVTILSWESGSSIYPFEIGIFEESDPT